MSSPMPPLEGTKRVLLTTVGLPSDVDDAVRRRAVVAIAKRGAWAGWGLNVDTPIGRRTQDRVDLMKLITEGRTGKGYSMCGDFVAYTYAMAGLRDEKIINRDDDNVNGIPDVKEVEPNDDPGGKNHWIVGMNVSMLIAGSQKVGAWIPANEGGAFPGDWFWIGDNGLEHVGVFISEWRECEDLDLGAVKAWYVDTVEGGQVDAGGQCVCQYVEVIRLFSDGRFFMSRKAGQAGRRLYGWGDLSKYDLTASAQVPESFDGGVEV